MRVLALILVLCFSNLSAEKIKIIFDLDETLCWNVETSEFADELHKKWPEFTRVDITYKEFKISYFFAPYVKEMLNFLLGKDFEIHFFSAADSERNHSLINGLLAQVFGAQQVEELKNGGQFKIFSLEHMAPLIMSTAPTPQPINPVLTTLTKRLRAILPDADLKSIMLIDNLLTNGFSLVINNETKEATRDLTELPLIRAANCPALLLQLMSETRTRTAYFSLNHAIYFAGIIEYAHRIMMTNKIAFRDSVSRALATSIMEKFETLSKCPSDDEHYFNRDQCLQIGLEELKKLNPAVKHFDDTACPYFKVNAQKVN